MIDHAFPLMSRRGLARIALTALAAAVAFGAVAVGAEPYGRGAPAPSELGAAAAYQALLDVGTDLRLMCVAAHPDDEDGATLAKYRRRYGVETHAVIATRGEGGQNEIGSEWDAELGVIRTWEMARAAEVTGAKLHYLNLPDFGYSKSRDEAFAVWGREETIARVVRVIREVRPDVIITHHGRMRDHGHHQAIGAALLEAFDLAADGAAFPECGAPWQATRLYIRSFEPVDGATTVDAGALDPVRGVTYAEIAADALRLHASQGMGFFIDRLLADPRIHYELVREAPQPTEGLRGVAARGSLFQGMQDRVSPGARAASDAAATGSSEDASGLDGPGVVGLLERVYAGGTQGGDDVSVRERARISRALARLEHLRVSAAPTDGILAPGERVTLDVRVEDFGRREADAVEIAVTPAPWIAPETPGPITVTLDERGVGAAQWHGTVASDAPLTRPYADRLRDDVLLRPAAVVLARMAPADGRAPRIAEVPVYADVAPAVEVAFLGAPYIVPGGPDRGLSAKIRLTCRSKTPREAQVVISSSQGLNLPPRVETVSFSGEDASQVLTVATDVPAGAPPRTYALTVQIDGGAAYHADVEVVDAVIPEGLRVGVIQSYDDTLSRTLEALGAAHASITEADYAPDALDAFDTVIVDLRAFLVREDAAANHQALLEYVARGGTLVVMYQKTFEWREAFAPYSLRISRNRVTREDAPVELLAPEHPAFTWPNVITEMDWDGWRQERGLYFADAWDARYTPLIAVADPGETPPPGAYLEARHGEGRYVYTALAWHRQLRDAHPGALRLFANLISLGRPAPEPTEAEAEGGGA